MIMGSSINGRSIAEAWQAGLALFTDPAALSRHDSDRGIAFDLPGLTLTVASISDLAAPAGYSFPALIDDYVQRLLGHDRDVSLLSQRLTAWEDAEHGAVDQLATIGELLKSSPATRAAAFSMWRPEADPHAAYAVSPVGGCFRIMDDRLHLLLVARSVDYWVGAVPELLAFARLQRQLAEELGQPTGGLVYHMWSAHVYEADCLANIIG